MEQVQHPHQLEYSGMGAGRCLSFSPVTKKGTLFRRPCGRCNYEFSRRYSSTPHPISESYEDLRAGHVCEPSEGAGRDTICIVFIP